MFLEDAFSIKPFSVVLCQSYVHRFTILKCYFHTLVRTNLCRLNAKIMEAGGSRVQSQQAKVDEIVKEIDGLHNRITKANVTIKTSARC